MPLRRIYLIWKVYTPVFSSLQSSKQPIRFLKISLMSRFCPGLLSKMVNETLDWCITPTLSRNLEAVCQFWASIGYSYISLKSIT